MDVEVSVTKISLAAELFFYAVVRDITERKRAAAALAEEATRRRVLFEQSKDGIAVLDVSGRTNRIEPELPLPTCSATVLEEIRQLYAANRIRGLGGSITGRVISYHLFFFSSQRSAPGRGGYPAARAVRAIQGRRCRRRRGREDN